MITNFYMPTRIVAGPGSLATTGTLARDLKMTRLLAVSDPIISSHPFHAAALDALTEAGLVTARFDECGIDARCSHIDSQGDRVWRERVDGIVCIGDGGAGPHRGGRRADLRHAGGRQRRPDRDPPRQRAGRAVQLHFPRLGYSVVAV